MSTRHVNTALLQGTLDHYKKAVTAEIGEIVLTRRFRPTLKKLLLEYPLREGKGLRPALCLATCEACGGRLEDALLTAAALELFHNAFLIHDDIEDESIFRRGDSTLTEKYGTAIAINVGDALNVLSVSCLLENTGLIGLDRALRVFFEVERMARESVEGQALELDWVKHKRWRLGDRDYFLMTYKKTSWYTCIAPCRIGAIIAGENGETLTALKRFGFYMGIAFQIQDDVLNLAGNQKVYGKESAGDLWEGKRTIMLIHVLNRAAASERACIVEALSLPRQEKSQQQVDYILQLMHRYGSLEYGRQISRRFAAKAQAILDRRMDWMEDSPHKQFLREMTEYVITREL